MLYVDENGCILKFKYGELKFESTYFKCDLIIEITS